MTLIYFVLVLSIVVFIHELGHFIFAKRAGIYVYEFSIGMGPSIFKKKRKNDETVYSIRLFPIGGYVRMAGEEIEEDKSIPKEKRMQTKTWTQKFLTIIAGIVFNFILAIIIFFIVALWVGTPANKPIIDEVSKNGASYKADLKSDDKVLKIDDKKVISIDHFMLELQVRMGKTIKLEVEHKNGDIEEISITPEKKKVDGEETYQYGFNLSNDRENGFVPAIKYAFTKTFQLIHQMILIVFYLITGKLGLASMSGPIGIFNVVGESAKAGFVNIVYLIGFLSVNVGFINLLPIPAFDGGRLLFLIMEKIKGRPINPKVENTIHNVGFILLMLLMVVITWNDILRLFK